LREDTTRSTSRNNPAPSGHPSSKMMKQPPHDAKAQESWRIFRAFLSSVSTSQFGSLPHADCWDYLAGDSEPDFLWPGGSLAVELTGWIEEARIHEGKTLEQFNLKIRDVLRKEPRWLGALEGHWARLEAVEVPPSKRWECIARRLLIFLADKAETLRDARLYLDEPDLPGELRAIFQEAIIYKMWPRSGPSVSVSKRAAFTTGPAFDCLRANPIESLRINLRRKMQKAEKYRTVGKARGFDKVWLVIHYDDTALEWAAPLLGPEVQFDYGPDAHDSQRNLAERVQREVWPDLQRGCFDKVLLLFPDQPAPLAVTLWPRSRQQL
jgi:hypothetical protein